MQNVIQLTQTLKTEARRLGFALVGACPAVTPTGFSSFAQWLDAGYAGEMDYLAARRNAYEHPQHVMEGVQSLLMLGMNYQTSQPDKTPAGSGRIARYAWGDTDYHDLVHGRLKKLRQFVSTLPGEIKARGVVDTAPLLEREFAQLAGLGWAAKNTMLISRDHGSWFFIAALLVDVELAYDEPFRASHCGTCTACLDACPTNAFPHAGVLDATKCISYLTIEHRSPIPPKLRQPMGDWVLGCDVCQEVCPWNRKSSQSDEPAFESQNGHNPLALRELFSLDDDSFRQRFRKTPLWRPKRRGILRNAAIALGNNAVDENIPALKLGLHDLEPLVRGASAWSLGRHRPDLSIPVLNERLAIEKDEEVRREISNAIF